MSARATTELTQAIRVVEKLTGIRAETLRMWERRYGFPLPQRTSGGSRLYSSEDVARLKLIREAMENGYRPHEVVTKSEAELTQLLHAFRGEPVHRPVMTGAGVGGTVTSLLDLAAREDVAGLRVALRAAALALGPSGFVTQVAGPLLVAVGEAWSAGALSVRHEHLVSEYLSTHLRLLLAMQEGSERAPMVLLATLPGESHALGAEMVAVYLSARGASPRILGANTPILEIAASASAQKVDAVAVSISVAAEVPVITTALENLRQALPSQIPLWVGGLGATKMQLPANATHLDGFGALDAAVDAMAPSRR
jgi:methanogenic corrinoid protein MtbC1